MKRTPRRTIACSAAAWLLAMLSPVAGAVSVSTTGMGQVLLFPYYTVRPSVSGAGYNTLFTITNSTSDTKVIRVRFRESRNGREALGVNVYLGPFDAWVGALFASGGGAVLATDDRSCVDPPLPPGRQLPFSNLQYTGVYADGEDTSLSRTMEGYMEVFDLGVVKDPALLAAIRPNPNCAAVLGVPLDNSKLNRPTGGLWGDANIVSILEGTLYSFDATALANFTALPIYSAPNMFTPTLADVNPKVSLVFDDSGAHQATWDTGKGANPADPVSAVLMADLLVNAFVLDAVTASMTDWVITMPTKPDYVLTTVPAQSPFESTFRAGGAPEFFGDVGSDCNGSTDRTVDFDREGRTTASGSCFPEPPPSVRVALPWTAGTLTFNAPSGGLLGGYKPVNFSTPFPNGWLKLKPFQYPSGHVHQMVSTDSPPVTYFGLPMIGFMANDYVNRMLSVGTQTVLSNYGATSTHRSMRRMQ